jgi:hypothetical protein
MMQDQGATTGSGMSSGSQSSYGASRGGTSASSTSPNATVAAIEVLPRSSSSATEGDTSGASAAMGSGAGGSTASSSDRVYRVTLRMDDGSTQVVTQQTTPDFRTGDRVALTGGVIQH